MTRREFMAGLGGAAAWPLVARAQQRTMPVIGYLDYFARPREPRDPYLEALCAGLADGGFVEGTNLFIEYRWAGGNYMRLGLSRVRSLPICRSSSRRNSTW